MPCRADGKGTGVGLMTEEDYDKVIKGETLTDTIEKLIDGLSNYKNDFYQTSINYIITELKNRLK